jgi:type 1 fimbria pilin
MLEGLVLISPRTMSIMRRGLRLDPSGSPSMKLMLVAIVAAGMSSCQSPHLDIRGSNAATNGTQPEVTFEIKSLTWNYTARKSLLTPSKTDSWDYDGHAIVVTKAPSLQQGSAVALLEYRATPADTLSSKDWQSIAAELMDGTAEIEFTIHYSADRYEQNPGQPKLEWRVRGYIPVVPAKVSVD